MINAIDTHDPDMRPGFGLWAAALLLLAASAVVVSGCSETAGLPPDAYQAEADAVVAMAFAADPVLPGESQPVPDGGEDLKPGDTCPDCRGTGRSGDGIGQCGTCGGDGEIDRDDIVAAPPAIGAGLAAVERDAPAEIVLHVTKGNAGGWPQAWWKETGAALDDRDDVIVSVVRDEASEKEDQEPWFELFRGDKRQVVSREELKEMFQ